MLDTGEGGGGGGGGTRSWNLVGWSVSKSSTAGAFAAVAFRVLRRINMTHVLF